jgi:hypothetical protein
MSHVEIQLHLQSIGYPAFCVISKNRHLILTTVKTLWSLIANYVFIMISTDNELVRAESTLML